MATQWNSNTDSTSSPTPWTGEPTKENSVRSFARSKTVHPQSGTGETNEQIQDRRATEAKEKQESLARTKEVEKSKEVKDNYKNTVLSEKSRELKQTIGQAGDEVIGRVNKFLNEGKTQIDNLSSAETVYNPQTGKWELSNVKRNQGFDTLAQEKYQELQRLRETADTFFVQGENGQWEPREFRDVVADHYNSLDPDNRMKVDARVNKLMSLAEQINRLEQLDQGQSIEAQNLRRQLNLEDRDGTVSGLYEARQTVKDLLEGNISFSGDEGADSRTVGDILNLGLDEIRGELEKAAASSSGLFGGDYSAAIKNALDKDSEDYQKFVNEEVFFKNTISDTGKKYFNDIQTRLMGMAKDIQSSLKNVAPDLQRAMQFDPTMQEDSELLQTVFAGLDGGDPEDFTGFINDILFDPASGLALSERHKLANLIGDVMKQQGVDLGNLGEDALISNAMEELSETGTFSWINEDGTEKRLQPTGGQKALILHAANQGQEQLNKVFKDIVNGTGIDLEKTVRDLTTSKGYTALPMAIEGFMNNTIESFKTFKGSDTEKIVMNAALQATQGLSEAYARGEVSDADLNASMIEFIKNNPGIAQDTLKQKWDDAVKQNQVQATEIQKQIAQLRPAYEANLQKIAETSKNVLDRETKILQWIDDTKQKVTQEIVDNYPLAEAAFSEGDFAGKAAAYMGWSHEQLQARLPSAIKGLASMASLVQVQQTDPELYNMVEKKIKEMLPTVTNKTLQEIIKNFNPANMQASGRDNFMMDILGSGTGGTLAAMIDKALNSSILTHPQIVEARKELQTAKLSLAKSQGAYSKGMLELDKQEAVLKELSQKTSEMNILTPKNIVKTAANMARALTEDGVSATPPVFQGSAIDMGGTGQRSQVPGKLKAISGVTNEIHQGIQGDLSLKNVSGKLDGIKGFEGDLGGMKSINDITLDNEGAMDIGQVQDIKVDEAPPGGWSTTGANGGAMSGKARVNNTLVDGYYYKDPKTGATTFYADTSKMGKADTMSFLRSIGAWAEQSKDPKASNIVDSIRNKLLNKLQSATDFVAPRADANDAQMLQFLGENPNNYNPKDANNVLNNAYNEGAEYLRQVGYRDEEIAKMPRNQVIGQGKVTEDMFRDAQTEKLDAEVKKGNITPEQAKSLNEQLVNPDTLSKQIADEARRKQQAEEEARRKQAEEKAKQQQSSSGKSSRDWAEEQQQTRDNEKAVEDYNKKLKERYDPNALQVQ